MKPIPNQTTCSHCSYPNPIDERCPLCFGYGFIRYWKHNRAKELDAYFGTPLVSHQRDRAIGRLDDLPQALLTPRLREIFRENRREEA